MKLRFYMDVFGGWNPNQYGAFAMTVPGQKIDGAKRIAFDVTIPDSVLFGVDYVAPEVSAPTVVSPATPATSDK